MACYFNVQNTIKDSMLSSKLLKYPKLLIVFDEREILWMLTSPVSGHRPHQHKHAPRSNLLFLCMFYSPAQIVFRHPFPSEKLWNLGTKPEKVLGIWNFENFDLEIPCIYTALILPHLVRASKLRMLKPLNLKEMTLKDQFTPNDWHNVDGYTFDLFDRHCDGQNVAYPFCPST